MKEILRNQENRNNFVFNNFETKKLVVHKLSKYYRNELVSHTKGFCLAPGSAVSLGGARETIWDDEDRIWVSHVQSEHLTHCNISLASNSLF